MELDENRHALFDVDQDGSADATFFFKNNEEVVMLPGVFGEPAHGETSLRLFAASRAKVVVEVTDSLGQPLSEILFTGGMSSGNEMTAVLSRPLKSGECIRAGFFSVQTLSAGTEVNL